METAGPGKAKYQLITVAKEQKLHRTCKHIQPTTQNAMVVQTKPQNEQHRFMNEHKTLQICMFFTGVTLRFVSGSGGLPPDLWQAVTLRLHKQLLNVLRHLQTHATNPQTQKHVTPTLPNATTTAPDEAQTRPKAGGGQAQNNVKQCSCYKHMLKRALQPSAGC